MAPRPQPLAKSGADGLKSRPAIRRGAAAGNLRFTGRGGFVSGLKNKNNFGV
jgi:hypothetical protein